MQRRSDTGPALWLALVGVFALTGFVAPAPSIAIAGIPHGPHALVAPTPGPMSRGASPAAAPGPWTPTPRAGGGSVPQVNLSVFLYNASVRGGLVNATPNQAPGAMATGAGMLFVADQQKSGVSEVNLSTGLVVGWIGFPSGGQLGSLAFDSTNGELYGTDSSSGYLDAVNVSAPHGVAAEIKLGSPQQVAYVAASNEILATASAADSLLVYGGTNHSLLANYSLSSSPAGVAFLPSTGLAYVAEPSANRIEAVNLTSGARSNATVGKTPQGVAADPLNRTVLVTDSGSNQVSVLNGSTLSAHNVSVGSQPGAIVTDVSVARVFVADAGDTNLSVLYASNDSFLRSVPLAASATYLATSAGALFAGPVGVYNLTELNASTDNRTATLTVGASPSALSWIPRTPELLVGDALAGGSYVVNGSQPSVAPSPLPGAMVVASAYDDALGLLYLASTQEDRIWAISTSNDTVVASTQLAFGPDAIAFDPSTGRLFADDTVGSTLLALNASTLARIGNVSFPVPWYSTGLAGMAVDPSTQQLYVTESAAGRVAILNSSSLRWVTNLSVPEPSAVAWDPSPARIAVVANSTVLILNPASHAIYSTVRLGAEADSVTYSPDTGLLYLGLANNDSVEALSVNPAVPLGNISVLGRPAGSVFDPQSGALWIAEPSVGALVAAPLTPASPPWIKSFVAAPASVLVGTSFNLTAKIVDGKSPYKYSYTGLPPGCSAFNRTTIQCTPTATGNYTIRLEIRDSAGRYTNATGSVTISVLPPIDVSGFRASPSQLELGASTELNTTARVARGWLAYAYAGLPTGCASANLSSLRCTPTATGQFDVTVTVRGLLGIEANATVVVGVYTDPSVPSFTASPSNPDTGEATLLQVSAQGGLAPYTVAYAGLPGGCGSANTTNLSCRPDVPGNYTVVATLTDALGGHVNASVLLHVGPAPAISSFLAQPNALDLGGSTELFANASGGQGSLSYQYRGLPLGCASANVSRLACTPTETGNFSVEVLVHDAVAPAVGRTLLLVIASRPSVLAVRANPSPAEVGAMINFSVESEGGTGPLGLTYSGLPAACGRPTRATFSCQVETTGRYPVVVTITDALGVSAVGRLNLSVLPLGAIIPRILSFGASNLSLVAGTPFYLHVTTSNLTLPFAYAYTGLPPGCSSENLSVLPCTASSGGQFTITVTVTSPFGGRAQSAVNASVAPNPSSTQHGTGPVSPALSLLGWLGVIGAVLTATMIALLLARRGPDSRRRKAPASTTRPVAIARSAEVTPPPAPAAPPEAPPPAPPEPEEPMAPPELPVPSTPEALDELEAELDKIARELGEGSDPPVDGREP
ncbi:MAG TPA: hypothetical protein VGU43_02735 [Thermoplasmata archaeon]|nr:hypothetical protein [Thermoplasmata archaeon]